MTRDHPGKFVRDNVIPQGLSVTQAAKAIGVGRPALSNFLNGNASLSNEMAIRLEKTFGANAAELIEQQAAYELEQQQDQNLLAATVPFVPSFLEATSNDISAWSKKIRARDQLPVLMRKLVYTTCDDLTHVKIPGNDDAQLQGWDGRIESQVGNPWIPPGSSVWELSTASNVDRKANADFRKRTQETAETERKNATFVFVSSHKWLNKESWLAKRRAEKQWCDVRALDAVDLEHWLAKSSSTQAWFSEQLGQSRTGVKSLEKCWTEWVADSKPELKNCLFDEMIEEHESTFLSYLLGNSTNALRIVAESHQEGLAFVASLLMRARSKISHIADKVIVFTNTGPLTDLTTSKPGFVVVTANQDVVKEFAESRCTAKAIVVDHYSPSEVANSVITLKPLTSAGFKAALEPMGFGPDEISRLDHETGRSLTVLRRRLSQSPALKTPMWSTNHELATSLVAMALVGSWVRVNTADNALIELLSDENPKITESNFIELLNLDDAPVWRIGEHQGVISKVDVLYGIAKSVSPKLFERFWEIAYLVLSYRDPALDLPEHSRFAAVLYGKENEFSSALRDGIAETVVLLAIHGKRLTGTDSIDFENSAAHLVRQILNPLTLDKLQSQGSRLANLAEAAPSTFLEAIEKDLVAPNSALIKVMASETSSWYTPEGRCESLWALELLAWHPNWIQRVVDILVALAESELHDNLENKPSNSLKAIFRSWMPQTSIDLSHRIKVLRTIVSRNPRIAWDIAASQFSPRMQFGHYSNKPLWRDYAIGLGEPSQSDLARFKTHCIELCIDWDSHTRETLDTMIDYAESLDSPQRDRIKSAIALWAQKASDKDLAWLRERVREYMYSVTLRRRDGGNLAQNQTIASECFEMASDAFNLLQPNNPVWEHAWLFEKVWVRESYQEVEGDLSYESRNVRISEMRMQAMSDVLEKKGVSGVIELALCGDAPYVAGEVFANSAPKMSCRLEFVREVLRCEDFPGSRLHQFLLEGFFRGLNENEATAVIEVMQSEDSDNAKQDLIYLMPFEPETWDALTDFDADTQQEYWSKVRVGTKNHDSNDMNFAVKKLLSVGRSSAAFEYAQLDWGKLASEEIHAILRNLRHDPESRHYSMRHDSVYIKAAIAELTDRQSVPHTELARLEWSYLDFHTLADMEFPNLELALGEEPTEYASFVQLACRKSTFKNEKHRNDEALLAWQMLEAISRLPGQDNEGQIDADHLRDWIHAVQTECDASDCRRTGDYFIGRLLSSAPSDANGVWPILPVREFLEERINEDIKEGIMIGVSNSVEGQIIVVAGEEERQLANQYSEWSMRCATAYPKTASLLRDIADRFMSTAKWWEKEKAIEGRLRQ